MSNKTLSLADFHKRHLELGPNDIILDVRNPDEFQQARIKGAVNFPLPEITGHIEELRKYDHVYIHCKRGGRAKTAFETLKSAGLMNLICIDDAGMDAWIESGYPTERD